MSSPKRRAQNARELEQRQQERADEQLRRARLTMWQRIEEADTSEDVKDILHSICEKIGLE